MQSGIIWGTSQGNLMIVDVLACAYLRDSQGGQNEGLPLQAGLNEQEEAAALSNQCNQPSTLLLLEEQPITGHFSGENQASTFITGMQIQA